MILCVGLSPTVQRTLLFPQAIAIGDVNRAERVWTTASGKAANVARVAATLGASSELIHPLGGPSGEMVARLLEADGVVQRVVRDDGAPTRTCTTLLAGETTELVEEAPPVAAETVARIRALTAERLGAAQVLCLSGSLPRGVDPGFLAELAEMARVAGVPVLLDTQKAPLQAALASRPWLVKPNLAEARATLGLPPDTDALRAAEALVAAGAERALVSEGKSGGVLVAPEGRWRLHPPAVDAINAIGSGDSLAAGLLVGFFARGLSLGDAVRLGVAAAAANCLSATSGVVDTADVARLLPGAIARPL